MIESDPNPGLDDYSKGSICMSEEGQVRVISQPSRLTTPLLVLLAPSAVLAVVAWPLLLLGTFVSKSEPVNGAAEQYQGLRSVADQPDHLD